MPSFASMDKFTASVLSSPEAAQLKLISRWGVGYDAIDIPAATAQGSWWPIRRGCLNETVADFAFALLLSIARRVHIGHVNMSQGVWRGLGKRCFRQDAWDYRLRTDWPGHGPARRRFQHAPARL